MIIDLTTWEWPQWVYFWMIVLNIILGAFLHGKPRGNYSFPSIAIGSVVGTTILYFGGFWGNL